MGWDVVGLAAPKGPVREKGEKISCPTHGKGSALVPPHHPHPVGIWVPCGTASTPLKPALGLGSAWFKAPFPGGSDTWGQATSTRSHLRGGGQGGNLQNSSQGVPEPRGGCGSGSLPPWCSCARDKQCRSHMRRVAPSGCAGGPPSPPPALHPTGVSPCAQPSAG